MVDLERAAGGRPGRGVGGHEHGDRADDRNERRVFWAMCLTGGFMAVEVAGGLISGSLALLADAGHMLTDFAALAMAWFAFRLGRKPADRLRSYGYSRIQVLAAFVNGMMLIVVVGGIALEAARRLFAPVAVMGETMLAVAALGLLVNLVVFAILRGGQRAGGRENLNLRGAMLHVLGDLLGSVAAIAAAVTILATGWMPIDPLLSILVAALIARSAWLLLRKSGHILLEGTPDWLDLEELRRDLHEADPAVEDIHHVHVWSLTSERPMVTLHARLAEGADPQRTLEAIQRRLKETFGIGHSTIQIERENCGD